MDVPSVLFLNRAIQVSLDEDNVPMRAEQLLVYLGLFPNWFERDPNNALENAREAMELAEKWLGIPQVHCQC
jgi:hypothetical protein